MLTPRVLGVSSDRLKKIPGVRRIAGTRIGRRAAERLLSQYGTRAVMRDTVRIQRNREFSSTDVVLVSSNGAGLGHLTRLEAISRKLQGRSLIYTLSRGYGRVGKSADQLVYFPSAGTLDLDSRTWNLLLFNHFGSFVSTANPKVIVFDGTYLYPGLVEVSRLLDIPLVWLRRGRWKEAVRQRSVQHKRPQDFCDLVVVPGEYASTDVSPEANSIIQVDPVLVFGPDELLSRESSLSHFGLDPSKRYVLVQLGAGTINSIDNWVEVACKEVSALGPEWRPVLLKNPLRGTDSASVDADTVEAFPVSLYLNAFDFLVVAAGYNSVQEAIASRIPFVMVPNEATGTDDQMLRASAVQNAGLGIRAGNLDELTRGIRYLSTPAHRDSISEAQGGEPPAEGANQIARLLIDRFVE